MSNSSVTKTLRIFIKGKVQGVFYRKYAEEAGRKLNLSGFVMNRSDGSVYAEATGTDEQLQAFINWCHQGSPRSQVISVDTEVSEQESHTGKFTTR